MIHGPQCICEICTCGRHQCPHDRNHSSLSMQQTAAAGESPFYRKEFAAVSPNSLAERARPIKPRGELSFTDYDNQNDQHWRYQNGTNAGDQEGSADKKNRFITSAALKKRTESSQISTLNQPANGQAEMLSTYQDQIKGVAGEERQKPFRPNTSTLWKNQGTFDGTSVAKSEFTPKQGDRYSVVRQTGRGILPSENDRSFQQETSNISDYGPKKIERSEMRSMRPTDSDILRNQGPFDSSTNHREEYREKKGDRYSKKVPENASGELLRGDGTFVSETSKNAEFKPGRGDRYEAKKQGFSDIWKTEGIVPSSTVNRDEYSNTKGDRFPTVRPQDSGVLFGDKNFVTLGSSTREDFTQKKRDAAQMKRPTTSDIWKTSGNVEKTTVSRGDYSHKQGERYSAKRPDDSNFIKHNGSQFSGTSHNRSEYEGKKGERCAMIKPESSELWKQKGALESNTVSKSEYSKKKGERFTAKRPEDAQLFEPNNDDGMSSTVSQREYVHKKGERYDVKSQSPSNLWDREGTMNSMTTHGEAYSHKQGDRWETQKPPDSEILKGDGTFTSETVNAREYRLKKGERYDMKKQGPSDLWKKEGEIARSTVNRDEYYSSTKGDRFDVRKPEESGILRRKGPFASESHNSVEFVAKRAEKAQQKEQGASDIWKTNGAIESMTVNRNEYGRTKGERHERRIPKDSEILSREGKFQGETITNQEYTAKKSEKVNVKKPEASDMWKRDGMMNGTSTTHDEFTMKKGEHFEKHVPAASLSIPYNADDNGVRQRIARSVTQDDFVEKQGERVHPMRYDGTSFSLLTDDGASQQFLSRTMTQDEFGPKTVERERPIKHTSALRVDDPNVSFDSHSMYSDDFQNVISSGERVKPNRPPTALKSSGSQEFISRYKSEYQNKVKPCPAGELVESVKKDHATTENFEFHALNKGHHFYKSKENLAEES